MAYGIIMKLKTITDVITNSSSEVFIIKKDSLPDFIGSSEYISISDFNCYAWDELEAICDIMGWNPEDTGAIRMEGYFHDYWDWPVVERNGHYTHPTWDKWCEEHKKELYEKLSDLLWVDIEDHYEDCEEDYNEARSVCIWSDYRH